MTTDTEALKALLEGAEKNPGDMLEALRDHEQFKALELIKKLRAALPALERMLASQTQDMVLVPRELTPDMTAALLEANVDHEKLYPQDGIKRSERIWSALLSAAPVASQMGDVNTVTLDKRDLFDFVRGEIKQALDETDTFTESEKWEEAHQRTEDCLGKLYAAPAAGMDVWQCAEDICAYLMRELGHDTDNIDRDEIAAIIRKYQK